MLDLQLRPKLGSDCNQSSSGAELGSAELISGLSGGDWTSIPGTQASYAPDSPNQSEPPSRAANHLVSRGHVGRRAPGWG